MTYKIEAAVAQSPVPWAAPELWRSICFLLFQYSALSFYVKIYLICANLS